jgi:hypothetical protein
LKTTSTKPLALGNVGDTVAFLMHGQVTHITEQYNIRVFTIAVHADAANGFLVDRNGICTGMLEHGFLLQPVHQKLEVVCRDGP